MRRPPSPVLALLLALPCFAEESPAIHDFLDSAPAVLTDVNTPARSWIYWRRPAKDREPATLLVASGPQGAIGTRNLFEDAQIEVQWRHAGQETVGCGILLSPSGFPAPGAAAPSGTALDVPKAFLLAPPAWNTLRAQVQSGRLACEINGRKLPETECKGAWHACLLARGTSVEYRKLRVVGAPARQGDKVESLSNGFDLVGWSNQCCGAKTHGDWKMEDGLIRCAAKTPGEPLTRRLPGGDWTLLFDWRPEGRGPKPIPFRLNGLVLAAGLLEPKEGWNRLEIAIHQDKARVTLNGTKVPVAANACDLSLPRFFRLENKGESAAFRNPALVFCQTLREAPEKRTPTAP